MVLARLRVRGRRAPAPRALVPLGDALFAQDRHRQRVVVGDPAAVLAPRLGAAEQRAEQAPGRVLELVECRTFPDGRAVVAAVHVFLDD